MAEMLPVAEIKPKNYEVMFMFNQAEAAQLGRAVDHIHELFGRAGVEVLAMQKWDERRLAFEMDKQKRAAYILAYFRGMPDSVAKLERDVQISEHIMRALIIKADHLTDEEIASTDDREGLRVEARMRAERGADDDQQGPANVRLGAPERARPAAEAPADDEDGDDANL